MSVKKVITIVAILCLASWFIAARWSDTHTEAEADSAREAGTVQDYTDYLSTIDTSNFSTTQQAVLAVLRQEYAKSPTSYDKNVLNYTEGFEESWCADFLSWVFDQADTPFVHPDTGYWRVPGVLTLQEYYEQHNAYRDVGDYTPKFGDVAFYFGETPDGGSTEHVAMVLAVEDDRVITIGGNETGNTVRIRADLLRDGEKGLSGFGASGI